MRLNKNSIQMTKTEIMKQFIVDYPKSGLTKNDYCKAAGVPIHQFYYWQSRLNTAKAPESSFLKVKTDTFAIPSIELEYPNGVKLRLTNTFNFQELDKLIRLY